jgi:8-oxo-dGTP pyrophosphatase MutT (NUDIX family)
VAETGVQVVFLSSAPGLYGRRSSEESWRDGFEWWEGSGLADARRQAKRLGLWVGMATQAGSTVDEDFPGIGALIAPDGDVVARLPDWKPGTLVVDIPVSTDVQPVRWSIRVLVIDESGRALLAEFGDDQTGRRWWVPPGGGIEEGEDDLTCARRELLEEVGRDDLEVGVAIGHRGGSYRLDGRWFTQYERWYLCRCSHFEVADEILTSVRPEGIRNLRWWATDEMRASAIDTGPRRLPDVIDEILAGRYPDQTADLGR